MLWCYFKFFPLTETGSFWTKTLCLKIWIKSNHCVDETTEMVQSSSSSLLSQDATSVDLRGRSLCFCQDSSPTSWLITWRYPRLLIGSFCQQMTPRRRAMRMRSRQPDTARLMITSEDGDKRTQRTNRIDQSVISLFFFVVVLACEKFTFISPSWRHLTLCVPVVWNRELCNSHKLL